MLNLQAGKQEVSLGRKVVAMLWVDLHSIFAIYISAACLTAMHMWHVSHYDTAASAQESIHDCGLLRHQSVTPTILKMAPFPIMRPVSSFVRQAYCMIGCVMLCPGKPPADGSFHVEAARRVSDV